MLKPVVNLIGNTKSPSSTIVHVFVELLKLYMKLQNIKNITNPLTQNLFIDNTFGHFNVQLMQYLNDMVYVISVYLWTAYQNFTIYKRYT